MRDSILVVAAHGDDEVLGAGGTIATHTNSGDTVAVLILSVSDTSRAESLQCGSDVRRASAQTAAAILGVTHIEAHDLPDNRFDSIQRLELVRLVETAIGLYAPRIVYTHHSGDLSADHRATAEAVAAATRPAPAQTVDEVLSFEIPSSTDWSFSAAHGDGVFDPNLWVALSASAAARKMEALAAYSQELHAFPHSRSLEAVRASLRLRGAQVGVEAAEAFVIRRRIVR